MEQKTYGLFVFLTASFAFMSGYYALVSVFGDWDPIKQGYHLSMKMTAITTGVALMYALMIGMIDREIVSARTKWAALLRIPLAIIIGVVIAVPIELRILQGRIHQKIEENQAAKLAPYIEQKNALIATIEQDVSEIEDIITVYTNELSQVRNRVRDEDLGRSGAGLTGLAGQGKFYRYARQEEASYEEEIERLKAVKAEKLAYRGKRLSELEADNNMAHTEPVYDLWEKYMVMHQVVREDETGVAKRWVYGISAFFILLELIPALMKLFNPKNDYDKLQAFVAVMIDRKLESCIQEYSANFEYDEPIPMPEIRMENLDELQEYRKSA